MRDLRDRPRAAVGGLEPYRARPLGPERGERLRPAGVRRERLLALVARDGDAPPRELASEHRELEERHVLRLVHDEVGDLLPGGAAPARREEEEDGQVLGVQRARERLGRVLVDGPAVERLAPVRIDPREILRGRRELEAGVPERLVDGGGREPTRRGGHHELEERPVPEEVAELAPERTERGAHRGEAGPAAEGLVERRVALQPGDERGRLLGEPRRRDAEHALERAAGPGVDGPDLSPVQAEGLEEPRREEREPGLGDDDAELRGREPLRVREGDPGEPVEGDGGLPAPGAPEDEERRVGRGGDRRVLLGVEERRDLGRGGPVPGAGAHPEGTRPRRGGLAAAERGAGAARRAPRAARAAGEGDAVCRHPREPLAVDHHHPADRDDAPGDPPRERLLVLLALTVPVEEGRHRRPAPVHHPDAGLAVDEGVPAEAVVALDPVLPDPEVGEVGRGGVGQLAGPDPLHHRTHHPHLLEDGGEVLRGGLEGLVAQLTQPPDQVAVAASALPRHEGRAHADEQRLLLGDDGALPRGERGEPLGGVCGVPGQVAFNKPAPRRPHGRRSRGPRILSSPPHLVARGRARSTPARSSGRAGRIDAILRPVERPDPRVTIREVVRDGVASPDSIAVEEPLEIRVDGEAVATTMRTPGADADLALGFLFAEGILAGAPDVSSVAHCGRPGEEGFGNVIDVRSAAGIRLDPERVLDGHRVAPISSACGVCGRRSIQDLAARVRPLDPARSVDRALLVEAVEAISRSQPGFVRTGGLHAAVLVGDDGVLLAAAEDVGRHNAVDKVIGALVRAGRLGAGAPAGAGPAVLAVSGRTGFEIVQKAAAAGVPAVASISAPTSLAVDLAAFAGITLAGFVRGRAMNVYAHAGRLVP